MEDKKGSVKQKGNFWNHDRKDALKGYLLIFPSILLLGIFTIYPIFYLLDSSLRDGSLLSKKEGVCRPGKLYHSVQKCGFSHDSEKYVYLFRWSGGNPYGAGYFACCMGEWKSSEAFKQCDISSSVYPSYYFSGFCIYGIFMDHGSPDWSNQLCVAHTGLKPSHF